MNSVAGRRSCSSTLIAKMQQPGVAALLPAGYWVVALRRTQDNIDQSLTAYFLGKFRPTIFHTFHSVDRVGGDGF